MCRRRDEELSDLLFGSKLCAPEDYRKPASSANSSKEQSGAGSKQATKNSSTNRDTGEEAASPIKNRQQQKRQDAPTQVHQPVVKTTLLLTDGGTEASDDGMNYAKIDTTSARNDKGEDFVREPKKKKKPTPDNSVETVALSSPSQ